MISTVTLIGWGLGLSTLEIDAVQSTGNKHEEADISLWLKETRPNQRPIDDAILGLCTTIFNPAGEQQDSAGFWHDNAELNNKPDVRLPSVYWIVIFTESQHYEL